MVQKMTHDVSHEACFPSDVSNHFLLSSYDTRYTHFLVNRDRDSYGSLERR